jgi:hypothetical protein
VARRTDATAWQAQHSIAQHGIAQHA